MPFWSSNSNSIFQFQYSHSEWNRYIPKQVLICTPVKCEIVVCYVTRKSDKEWKTNTLVWHMGLKNISPYFHWTTKLTKSTNYYHIHTTKEVILLIGRYVLRLLQHVTCACPHSCTSRTAIYLTMIFILQIGLYYGKSYNDDIGAIDS